ncbi:hypothetical protein E1A91_A08G074200v1 [Gossypium mustelinum]|uniref:Uncharacterized protein n=1 Tax=Gossypium mustelinum TaxID=34275 RepID=A0A5D2Y6J4_GOSMU|nr:hypothetical protein E1A91_A08G074200v1 [Gossypium mustelinum]
MPSPPAPIHGEPRCVIERATEVAWWRGTRHGGTGDVWRLEACLLAETAQRVCWLTAQGHS